MSKSLRQRQLAAGGRKRPRPNLDKVPPVPVSATVDALGLEILLELSEEVSVESWGTFTINASGGAASVITHVFDDPNFIVITPGRVIEDGETLTLDWDGAGDIRDPSGNAMVAFSGFTLDNQSEANVDTEPPLVQSAEIEPSGDILAVVFNEDVTGNSGLTITPSGGAATLTPDSTGVRTIKYATSRTIQNGETLTLAGTSSGIDDAAGNSLEDFSGFVVDNKSNAGLEPTDDPLLPEEFDTPSLPAHYADPADYTPTDGPSLQAIFDLGAAIPAGSIIELQAGNIYQRAGGFVIPATCKGEPGNEIIIRSSAHASLPAYGNRAVPADAANLAQIRSWATNSTTVIDGRASTDGSGGCSYLWFSGIDFYYPFETTTTVNQFIKFAYNPLATDAADLPQHITFERCLVHGATNSRLYRAVAPEAKYFAFLDSSLYEIHALGNDGGHAFQIANTTGPVLIENNFIECSGITVFLGDGGGSRATRPLQPSNIRIIHNHFFVRPEWEGVWTAKNFIESKDCFKILIDRNIFENGWLGAQPRAACFLKGDTEGCFSQHVTFRNNLCKNGYVSLRWGDGKNGLQAPSDTLWEDNLFYGMQRVGSFGGVLGGSPKHKVRRNTFHAVTTSWPPIWEGGESWPDPHAWTKCQVTDNIFATGSATPLRKVNTPSFAAGAPSFNFVCAQYDFTHNVFWSSMSASTLANDFNAGAQSGSTAHNNSRATSLAGIGFVDPGSNDWRLSDESPFAEASSTGGKPGCDVATLNSLIASVETGQRV